MKFLILALLPTLVLAHSSIPEYVRGDWEHWIDPDEDCQNTRHELLIRESIVDVTYKTNRKCFVKTGAWFDPYRGELMIESSDLDVDHIIPLKWAHTHGGWRWSKAQKKAFANDHENLWLIDDEENQQWKSAKGPAQYLPKYKGYHCAYVSRWRYLLDKYNLTPGKADRDKINQVHKSCNLL